MKKWLIIVSLICLGFMFQSCKKKTCPAYSNGEQVDKPDYKKSKRSKAKLF